MSTSLFGLEAELAVSARKGEAPVPVTNIVHAFMAAAKLELEHLPGAGTRLYLGNGALLYIDAGEKVEVATPECTTPWEAVAQLRSAERMVYRLASLVREQCIYDEVLVTRCNVDYFHGATWGAHESYLTRRPIAHYEPWIVPHLASRIIYTGSGGLDALSPGIHFSLSPRIAHIQHVRSGESTSSRGLFHTRDESLSSGFGRLHVLAGNNCCSQLQTLLQVASTALIVALAETGLEEPPLALRDPVTAAQGFARDPGHRASVRQPRGTLLMSALEIQYQYLERIEARSNAAEFPEWAPQVCQLWRNALELVSRDAGRGVQALDWTLKRDLFDGELARSGFTWDTLGAWSEVVEQLRARSPPSEDNRIELDGETLGKLRARHPRMNEYIASARAALEARGLDWSGLDAFNALRRRLCEIDVRFGQVNDGLFDTLDRRGLLPDHRVVSEADIAAAAEQPPAQTRAHLRGAWVRRLAADRKLYRCTWDRIYGETGFLDVSDPFATEGEWTVSSDQTSSDEERTNNEERRVVEDTSGPLAQRQQAANLYCAGDYPEAETILVRLLGLRFETASTHCHLARIYLITDHTTRRVREHVAQAWAHRSSAPAYVVARTLWLQLALAYLEAHTSPRPSTSVETDVPLLLGKLKDLLQSGNAGMDWTMEPVLDHLRSRLSDEEHALLSALVTALSNGGLEALEALDIWQAQAPVPAMSRQWWSAASRLSRHGLTPG